MASAAFTEDDLSPSDLWLEICHFSTSQKSRKKKSNKSHFNKNWFHVATAILKCFHFAKPINVLLNMLFVTIRAITVPETVISRGCVF